MAKYLLKPSWLIAMARKYKNWQEKRVIGTRAQMWDFHWKPGDKNYTIWAMLYKDYTGANYQGQAWCAMFGTVIVALTFKEHYNLSDAEAVKATREFFGGSMPFNCQRFVDEHRGDSRLSNKPSLGAAVIYHTGKKYGHWGAVVTGVDANGKGFTDVEGNTSGGNDKVDPDGGAVVEKWHSVSSKTLFWNPGFMNETISADLETYKILSVGEAKLTITSTLNIRDYPGTGKVIGSYKTGDKVVPTEKTFVNHKAWYHTDSGWISASYVEGWVQEADGLWWYVHKGYTCTTNGWEEIDEKWYYMEDTGYIRTSNWVTWKGKDYYLTSSGAMATNSYIKSTSKEWYYWVGPDGAWDGTWDTETPGKYPDKADDIVI